MNRFDRVASQLVHQGVLWMGGAGALLAMLLAGAPVAALGQSPEPSSPSPVEVGGATSDMFLPESLITNPAMSTANHEQIKAFVNKQLSRLRESATLASARKSLVNSSTVSKATNPNAAPSAAFSQEYDSILNAAVKDVLADPKLGIELRLNIAIVVARVALNAKNAQAANAALAPAALALAACKDDAVCLWGMKALGAVIAPAASNNNLLPLQAVIPAVQAHHFKGFITDEAYLALDPETPAAAGNAIAQTALLGELLKVYQLRVASYKTGLPEEPTIDPHASLQLTSKSVWALMTPNQQTQAMQAMIDIISMALQSQARPGVTPDQSGDMPNVISQTAGAISVAGGYLGNATLSDMAATVAHDPPSALPTDVPKLILVVKGAFPGIVDPPTISSAAESSTTMPSSSITGP